MAYGEMKQGWAWRYALILSGLILLWAGAYRIIKPLSEKLVSGLFGLELSSTFGSALAFFFYDSAKILLLLVALIYGLALLRASLNVERVRDYLGHRRRGTGYVLGAVFGAVTPFCSCSSIPLFLGFTTAAIPVGITMSFLITSPLINELAVVLLWNMLGWKFTVVYVLVGLTAGIVGGLFMDGIKAERWLQPFVQEVIASVPVVRGEAVPVRQLDLRDRHLYALGEMKTIFRRVWKWVIIGVGIGALLHGFIPAGWFSEHLGRGEWWTVPAAVLTGIPLYSNVSGIVPIMESLLIKGMPLGTTMAFCMSAVTASLPEVMMLRQVMTLKLQAAFIAYLWVVFSLVGWLFNALGPDLLI